MKLCDGNGGKVEKEQWQKAKVEGRKWDQAELGVCRDLISCFWHSFYDESPVQGYSITQLNGTAVHVFIIFTAFNTDVFPEVHVT